MAQLHPSCNRHRIVLAFGFLALLVSFLANVACADTPPDVSITIDSAPSPSPCAVNQNTSASFSVEFTDPATGQEIQPPAGTTYQWGTGTVQNGGSTDNHYNLSFGSPTAQSTSETASFGDAGGWSVGIQCVVSNSNWSPSSLTASTSYSITVQTAVVTFSSNSIVAGYASDKTITTNVTAQVDPPNDASRITFGFGGTSARILIPQGETSNNSSGQITFTTQGVSATPSSARYGDTTLYAYYQGINVGQTQAVVPVPTYLVVPNGSVSQNVPSYNLALSPSTRPSAPDCPSGYYDLETNYSQYITY